MGQNLDFAEWTISSSPRRIAILALGKQNLIFYIAGSLTALNGPWLSAAAFSAPSGHLLQDLPAAAAFARRHSWLGGPYPESGALNVRSALQHTWLVPIVVMILGPVLSRLNWFSTT